MLVENKLKLDSKSILVLKAYSVFYLTIQAVPNNVLREHRKHFDGTIIQFVA